MTSILEKEIYQQPDVIRNLVNNQSTKFEELSKEILKSPPRFILIVARGTSDNAAIYAKYLFSGINKIPVGLAMPSLYTLYKQTPIMQDGLVIGISQSGQSPDVYTVLEDAQRQGVLTISITNEKDSPIAKVSDHNIFVEAGKERSVAASKTFTSQMTAIAMLVAYLSGDEKRISDLMMLNDYIEEALTQKSATQTIADRFSKKNHLAIISRGYNHCTTHEIALKIKELSYIVAQPYSAADFRHPDLRDPGERVAGREGFSRPGSAAHLHHGRGRNRPGHNQHPPRIAFSTFDDDAALKGDMTTRERPKL